jgi:hypothetical protein
MHVAGATGYEIHRSVNGSPFTLLRLVDQSPAHDTALASNTTYVYKVRATDGANTSAFTAPEIATTVVFTDDPLQTGGIVKAVHMAEMRAAVNSVRRAAGLAAWTFTDADLSGVAIRAAHLTDLRSALNEARQALGMAPISYFEPGLISGATTVKREHFEQIRAGVR